MGITKYEGVMLPDPDYPGDPETQYFTKIKKIQDAFKTEGTNPGRNSLRIKVNRASETGEREEVDVRSLSPLSHKCDNVHKKVGYQEDATC